MRLISLYIIVKVMCSFLITSFKKIQSISKLSNVTINYDEIYYVKKGTYVFLCYSIALVTGILLVQDQINFRQLYQYAFLLELSQLNWDYKAKVYFKKVKDSFRKMLKNTFVLASLCSLPVFNQFIKTQVTKTQSFKKTISQIQKQLRQINITFTRQSKENTNQQQLSLPDSQQAQNLYDLILTPQVEKYLSTKSKNKIQLIRKLKQGQSGNIKLNASISAVNLLGSFVYMPFFYYSTIAYALFSQLSLFNDFYTIKTGKKLANLPYNSLSELYLKVSVVLLVAFSLKAGLNKLINMAQTKEIVKKD